MNLEQMLETAMVRQTEEIGAASFTAAEILHKGRYARHRRRTLRALAGAAVVLAVVATLTATSLPRRGALPPVGSSPQVWPIPTSLAQDGPGPASLRISYANGATIVPWNARPITMDLPPQTYITTGYRVDGGWVVVAITLSGPAVAWFQPDNGGHPTRLASTAFAVSADRHMLVVADPDEPIIRAYDLPSLSQVSQARVPANDTGRILAVTMVGSDVLVRHAVLGNRPDTSSWWDLSTGVVIELGAAVDSLGIAPPRDEGSVLRRVNYGDKSCVDIMPRRDFTSISTSGVCSEYLGAIQTWGLLSPDGRQAAFGRDDETSMLVDTADLLAGVWRPTTVTGARMLLRWTGPTTFLAFGDGHPSTVLYCTGPDTCGPIGLPAGQPRIAFLTDLS